MEKKIEKYSNSQFSSFTKHRTMDRIREARSLEFQNMFSGYSEHLKDVARKFLIDADRKGHHQMSGTDFEGTCLELTDVLPLLRTLCPSIACLVDEQKVGQPIKMSYSQGDLIIPDFILDEVSSPMSQEEDWSPLHRSMSSGARVQQYPSDDCPSSSGMPIITGRDIDHAIRIEALAAKSAENDWCVTPKSVSAGDDCPSSAYAEDDCPSSSGMPKITGRENEHAIRVEALAAKSAENDWCVTPKSVPAGDDCPSSAYAEDETPIFADDDCPSSIGGSF